tara:strand:+ start:805 stop:1863 length:1059 start_codon:yes stop_codon:yes gene_type:complete
MDNKLKFCLRYCVFVAILWVGMALGLAAARYASEGTLSYWEYVFIAFDGLMVAVLLVPLIGFYAYRLVAASQPRVVIVVKICIAIIAYYSVHVPYIVLRTQDNLDLSVLETLAQLRYIEWFWGIFFIVTWVVMGVAVGMNQRRQQAELAKLELDKMLLEVEAKLASEQNDHIRQRLGSHFVLNALSNIIALVRTKQTSRAIDALHLLSDILREVAHANQGAMHSLEEELTFLEKYLAFQKIRFPDLNVKWDIVEAARELPLPSHILQPLVENAFKHGMRADGTLDLYIAAAVQGDYLQLEVNNSVANRNGQIRKGEGQTLTKLRLEKTFGRKDLFKCRVTDAYYHSVIRIPV